MIYTFKTRREVIQHIHALCQLSSSIEHSNLPITDLNFDTPQLLQDLTTLKYLFNKYSCRNSKIYIGFRTTGFESSTIYHHFYQRITAFRTSVIACYTISYADGFYILKSFEI